MKHRYWQDDSPSNPVLEPDPKAVEIVPISDADLPAVADFLRTNMNGQVHWEATFAAVPWQSDAPNRGFMMRQSGRVVGALLALYSERLVAGCVERFCNLGSWCVLPAYRSRSISLLNALLAQDGYHFTVLSPDRASQEILPWMKFRRLDTSAALIPNLPWPSLPGRISISADPRVIASTLSGSDRKLYHDHAGTLATRHLVLTYRGEYCYVMYREFRYRDVPVFAVLLHVSNPELFHRGRIPLTRYLLVRRRLIATMAELRLIGKRPRQSFALDDWPKLYRSPSLDPQRIDYLYSELNCVPWSRGSFPGRHLISRRRQAVNDQARAGAI